MSCVDLIKRACMFDLALYTFTRVLYRIFAGSFTLIITLPPFNFLMSRNVPLFFSVTEMLYFDYDRGPIRRLIQRHQPLHLPKNVPTSG